MGRRRNPIAVLVLFIVTLGIYPIVWFNRTNREMLEITKRDWGIGMWTALLAGSFVAVLGSNVVLRLDPGIGPLTAFVVCALAYLVISVLAFYKMADHVYRAHLGEGVPGMGVVPMFLLMLLPIVSLVGVPMVQAQMNKLW